MIIEIPTDWEKFLLSTTAIVNQICKPLFEKTHVKYFDYSHYYKDGSLLIFTSNPRFIFDVIQKKLYPTANEFQAFFKQGMRLTFLSENTHLPNAASENDLDKYENNIVLAKNHNIHHRLYIAEGRKDHVRLGGFAIDENKQSIFEFYLNSVDVLENFIVYFESKIETLLSKKKNHKIIILPCFVEEPENNVLIKFEGLDLAANFIPDTFSLSVRDKNIVLTRRELECLAFSLKGYSTKETAKILKISPKTIENRIYRTRNKLGHAPKVELRKLLFDHKLFYLFDKLYFQNNNSL